MATLTVQKLFEMDTLGLISFCVMIFFYNKVYLKRKHMAYLMATSFLDSLSI